ncbi:hypothetical protein Tco_0051327 [Tanacetum coccineum]
MCRVRENSKIVKSAKRTLPVVSDPDHNKGKTSYEVESDVEPLILQTFGDLQALYEDSEDDLKDLSDEEMYEVGEKIDDE